MTRQEFQHQVERLMNNFGAQHFKQERLSLLWSRVEKLSDQWFRATVDHMLSSSRHAPLPGDFDEHVSQEQMRLAKERKSDDTRPWNAGYACRWCKDVGVFMAAKHGEAGLWAFRCHCHRGEEDPRKKIPQMKQAHLDEGLEWVDQPIAPRALP